MHRKLTILSVIVIVAISLIGTLIYTTIGRDKFEKQIELGNKYLEECNYKKAILAFQAAIEIDENNIEARISLAETYTILERYNEAEVVLIEAIDIKPNTPELYLKLIKVYNKMNKDIDEIIDLIKKNQKFIQSKQLQDLLEQIIPLPLQVNLESGIYDDIQEVHFTNIQEGCNIYYTMDGTEANENSLIYADSIYIDEGETILKAIVINDMGISSEEIEMTYTVNKKESNFSNLVNGGYVAAYNDWIYFNNDTGLYRMKSDGSDEGKILDSSCRFIQIVDDWIYFSEPDYETEKKLFQKLMDEGKPLPQFISVDAIYKMKLDGKGKKKLAENTEGIFYVINKEIFYEDRTNGIYKMNLDGENKIKVFEDSREYFEFLHDYGIYRTMQDSNVNETNEWYNNITGYNNHIYYINHYIKGEIYKADKEWNNKTKLINDNVITSFNISDDYIYYYSYENAINRVDTDGENKTLIEDFQDYFIGINQINIANGWIFGYFVMEGGYDLVLEYMARIDSNNNSSWNASSSSILTETLSSGQVSYYAKNAMDGNINTAWVEGKSDNGIGESITFTNGEDQLITKISMINGYAETEKLYYKNNRVKKVGIEFSNGHYIEETINDNTLSYQEIKLSDPLYSNYVKVTILDIYKGNKYNDTCIAEIRIN